MSVIQSGIGSPVSALSLIAGMATTTKKKGKSDKPEICDPSLDGVIDEFIVRKSEAETAEALRDAAAQQIISTVRPQRLTCCQQLGKVVASVSVNSKLTFTQTCRYSAVPEERGDAMAAAFGPEFDRYFKPTFTITLKPTSANNEAVLNELIARLSPEFFAANFDVKRQLLVQEAFHNSFSVNPAVQAIAQPFIDEETIRAYSPSLKVQ
jgi:hypothetical protein